jgi:type IX secretion system PorP/SprF family membrane protein
LKPGHAKYHPFIPAVKLARRVLPFLLLCIWAAAGAQQTPVLSQYMFNNMFYNPAYAGNSGGICVNGLFREQWIGFKNSQGNKYATETMFLTVDAPIRKIHGGIGGSVMKDKIGSFDNISVNLGYAFRADLGAGTFAAGAQLQLDNIKLDFSKFEGHIIDEDGDPVLQQEGDQTDLLFDFALGLYYEVPEKYYIGLSAGQIAQSRGRNTYYQHRRTYTLTGGYNFVIPNYPMWELKPSAIFYYDGGAFQWNLSALVTYKKKFWGGLGYRFQDAAIILAGLNIKNFRVGLAYDISTSALTNYESGSMEVMVGYCFKMEIEKYRKRYKNTRFL